MGVVNQCLAANGGTLGAGGNEADRDGDFDVASHVDVDSGFGSATISAKILLNSVDVSYVSFRMRGTSSGAGTVNASLSLDHDGGTATPFAVGSTLGDWDERTEDGTVSGPLNNNLSGWTGCTAIYISMTGFSTGPPVTTTIYAYEMQAWGPGGRKDYSFIF